ncbi:cytochrome P450, putative [Ricinus communis]|uniref:Cytochrome P450, putative n=1 Tax=Ricinus communis TaxID=3988 RepID=B9SDG6_RICCO|nr:cytochrome P450, putative [Ricinus communis]|eukprot:XP_002524035.1 cytochrome P450 89A2 [Ricinus communis]
METRFIITIILSLFISALIRTLFNLFFKSKKHSLPPTPVNFPIIRNILWLRKSFSELEPIIRSFQKDMGPVITLHIGFRPNIFIADHFLAHRALVQNGAVFADRPRVVAANNVGLSVYGLTWRLFRRNLTSEILHPSRVKSYSNARKWVLEILLDRFELLSKCGNPVLVAGNFQYAMFCLLVLMCFGDKLDQKQIEEIQRVEQLVFANLERLVELNLWPSVTKILFRKRWAEFLQLEKEREDVMTPLIRARKKLKEERQSKNYKDQKDDEYVLSYVDTLLDLQLPGEKRKLTEKEMIVLCNEFLNAGTDTTSSSLQWIMANLVKYPCIQERLFMEIKEVVADGEKNVKEEDLQKMPYLKAVVLEGLRRHPPAHLVLPHAVTEDIVLGKYLIPKNANINFMIADMGLDPEVWEDPMAFKPERFISGDSNNAGAEVFDITGSREIKMMPFGVGRRICPAYGLAILHLEYFVANLVWSFGWKAINGDDVDLSEVQDFTVVMKNPLKAHISRRGFFEP